MKILCRPKITVSKFKNGKNGVNGIRSNGTMSNNPIGNSDSKTKLSSVKKSSGLLNQNKIKEKGVVIKVKKNESNKNVNDSDSNGVFKIDNNNNGENENNLNGYLGKGNEEFIEKENLNGINDINEYDCNVYHQNININEKLEKNGKNYSHQKDFQIEILSKNLNEESKTKLDFSEYDEVFIDSNAHPIIHDTNYNK